MEVKWIKLTTGMFEDDKIDFIYSLPEADAIIVIWVRLLTMAGKSNANGRIYLTEDIPYTEEMLAHKFKRPLNLVRYALETFARLNMVHFESADGANVIRISNWEKHQSQDRLEKIREGNRLRKQRQREREQLPSPNQVSAETSADVTRDNHSASHNEFTHGHDIDIELEKDIKTYAHSDEFALFWNLYPKKLDKQLAQKKFKAKRAKHSFETIMEGTKRYIAKCTAEGMDMQYIKYAKTFLHNDCFLDDHAIELEEKKPQSTQADALRRETEELRKKLSGG